MCLQLVTQSLWIIGSTTSVLFSPADRTYASGASVILKAVNSGSLPLLKSSFIAASVNSLSFKVSCSQYGKLAYHLSRSFSYNSTACSLSSSQIRYWLAQPSTDSLRASEVYYDCQDLFGILNMDANV